MSERVGTSAGFGDAGGVDEGRESAETWDGGFGLH